MHKIRIVNNWDYLTYFVGDAQIDEKRGGTCDVQWPDGSVSRCAFVSVPHTTKTYDHGHDYDTRRFLLRLEFVYHGLAVRVPIEAAAAVGNVVQ